MGIVDDSDFESELNNVNSSMGNTDIELLRRGRGLDNIAVPESLRKIIGETNEIDGRPAALELGKQFGISPSSISAYANGATSTSSYNQPSESLNNHVQNAKERIATRARHRLMNALKHITDDKLQSSDAKELAGVAKDMSVVIKAMEPDVVNNINKSGPTFIFYAPQFSKEETFDVVYTKE